MEKKVKEDEIKRVRIAVQYPKFKTLEEQVAFQVGLTLAFNGLAQVFDDATNKMLEQGENVLKDLGLMEADVEELRNERGGKKE